MDKGTTRKRKRKGGDGDEYARSMSPSKNPLQFMGIEDTRRNKSTTRSEYNVIKDASATLEHLLTVGAKMRRDLERRQKFCTSERPLLETLCDLPLNDPFFQDSLEIHAEDNRIYGIDGLTAQPWPIGPPKRGKPVRTTNDKEWDIEHGDTIHPLAFSKARLSQQQPSTKDEKELIDEKNLHVGSTDVTLTPEQLPRALLLRCWERAVHAASCTMSCPVSSLCDEGPESKQSSSKPSPILRSKKTLLDEKGCKLSSTAFGGTVLGLGSSTDGDEQSQGENCLREWNGESAAPMTNMEEPVVPRSSFYREQERVRGGLLKLNKKFTSLGMPEPELARKFDFYECYNCGALIKADKGASLGAVSREGIPFWNHFYLGEPNRRACCWNVIHKYQQKVISKTLENHIQNQIDTLQSVIMEKSKKKEAARNVETNDQHRLLNWFDVLKFLEESLESTCVPRRPKRDMSPAPPHPIIETLQVNPHGPPLLLNPMILDVVKQRLIDRYAHVPP